MPFTDIIELQKADAARNTAAINGRYNELFGNKDGQSTYTATALEKLEGTLNNSVAGKKFGTTIFDDRIDALGMPQGDMATRLPFFIPGVNMEDYLAKNQGAGTSVFNGLLKIPEKFLSKTIASVGYVGGLMGIGNHSEGYGGSDLSAWIAGAGDNALVQYAKKKESTIDNVWDPIYQEAADVDKGFFSRATHDLNFWTQDGTDALAFMLSAWVPGTIIAKAGIGASAVRGLAAARGIGMAEEGALAATGALSGASRTVGAVAQAERLGQLTKWASNAKLARSLDVGLTSMINTSAEAMSEAQDVKETTLAALNADPFLSKLPEEEKMRRAAEAARGTFTGNIAALAASNLFEANLMFKRLPGSSAAKELAERVTKEGLFGATSIAKTGIAPQLWDLTKDVFKGYVTEGLWEENVQLAIQRVNQRSALEGTESHASDIVKQYLKQTKDAAFGDDNEAGVSIGMGGLIGGGEVVVSSVGARKRDAQRVAEAQKYINQGVSNFTAIGNVYQTKEVTTKDADGKDVTKTVPVFDPKGNRVIDEAKLAVFMASQDNVLELNDLMHIAGDNGKFALKDILEGELFGKMAEAHFQLGLGDVLKEKLNDSKSLTDEDLAILGLSPENRTQANQKIEQLKGRVDQLQTVWDAINDNFIAPTDSKDTGLFEARKRETFRTYNRKISVQDTLNKELLNYAALQGKAMQIDGIVPDTLLDNLNKAEAKVQYSTRFLNQVQGAGVVEGVDMDLDDALNSFVEYSEARDKLLEDNKDNVPNYTKGNDGFYSRKNIRSLQDRDMKISMLKQSELELSINSVNNRIERLSDPLSGDKYFKKHQAALQETANPRFYNKRPALKNVNGYLDYENKSMRKERILYQYNNIQREYTEGELLANLPSMSIGELRKVIDVIRSDDNRLSKGSIQKLKDQYQKLKDARAQEIEDELVDIESQRDNNQVYNEDIDEEITADQDLDDRLIEQQSVLNKEKDDLDQYNARLDGIGEYDPTVPTDNAVRRKIADGYLIDADALIKSAEQTTEGFDTVEELDSIRKEIAHLEKLREINNERTDGINNSDEFKTLNDEIQTRIDSLEEIAKFTESRIYDRNLKDAKILNDSIKGQEKGIGVGSPLMHTVQASIIPELKETFDKALTALSTIDKDENPHEYIGALNTLYDLARISYQKLPSAERQSFDTAVAAIQSRLEDNVVNGEPITYAVNTGQFKRDLFRRFYTGNPVVTFANAIGAITQVTGMEKEYERTAESPFMKFLTHRNPWTLLEDIHKDDNRTNDNSHFTNEHAIEFVESHIEYLEHWRMLQMVTGRVSKLVEVESQIAVMEEGIADKKRGIYAPSNEQIRALQELTAFYYGKQPNSLFSGFSFLKGAAGTGKSATIAKWLPKLLRVKQNEVFATGTDDSSSRTINSLLGNDNSPSIDDLLTALTNNLPLRLAIIDEVGKLDKAQLGVLAQAVYRYNSMREAEGKDGIKVILLGDPNQMNISNGVLTTEPDVERFSFEEPRYDGEGKLLDYGNTIFNMTPISPLTIRYRSNVGAVSSFSDKFINQPEDLSNDEIIAKSNNPSLSDNETSSGSLIGVVGSNKFANDLIKILAATNFEDNKTRAIITNPERVEEYKALLKNSGVPLDKVEVLSYIDAQGRTVDDVYIDIRKEGQLSGQDNLNIFNRAMYVATSRATEFLLVGNMNIRNEEDNDITAESNNKKGDINEAPAKFVKDKKVQLSTEVGLLGDKVDDVRNNSVTLKPTEIKKEEKQEEKEVKAEEKKQDVEEVVEEEQPQEPDEEVEDKEAPTDIKTTILEKVKDIVIPKGGFLHNLLFPSYEATKNLTAEGEMSDAMLNRQKSAGIDVEILSPSIKSGDDVYYVPVYTTGKRNAVMLLTPYQNADGTVATDRYRQVGVLGDKEIEDMKDNPELSSIYDSIVRYRTENTVRPLTNVDLANKVISAANIPATALAKGTIAHIEHMKFAYGKEFKSVDLRGIIEQFANGYFGAGVNKADIDRIQKSAKIIIYTNKDLKGMKDNSAGLRPGIPYLRLSNLSKNSKPLHITLDRKVINKDVHKEFLQPLTDAVAQMNTINTSLPEGMKYGSKSYRNLLYLIQSTAPGTYNVVADGENVKIDPIGTAIEVTPELVASVNHLLGLWKDTTSKTFSKGSLVHHLDPAIDDNFRQMDKGEKKLIKSGAKVSKVITRIDENTGEKSYFVKLFYYQEVNGGIKLIQDDKEYPVDELRSVDGAPGEAQKVVDKLWKGNLANIKKILRTKKDFPMGMVAINEDGDTDSITRIVNNISILSTRASLSFWNDFLTFDKQGNHAPKDISTAFRIPVPRKTDDGFGNQSTFTDDKNNVLKKTDTEQLDYYLQSSFEGITPTYISVTHGKETTPVMVGKAKEVMVEAPATEGEEVTMEQVFQATQEDDEDEAGPPDIMSFRKASTEKYTQDGLGKALSESQVFAQVKRFFPNMVDLKDRLQFVTASEMLKITAGQEAWGVFKDNIIYLRTNSNGSVNEKVVRHEVMHMIFNNYLTTTERNRFIEEVSKENPNIKFLPKDQFDEYVDEYIAERFMDTPKELKNVNYYIRMILKKIREFFNFASPNIENLDSLFKAVEQGKVGGRYQSLDAKVQDFIKHGLESDKIKTNCK